MVHEILKFKEEGQDTWREFILFMEDHESEKPEDQTFYMTEYETRYVVLGFRCGRYGTERVPQHDYRYPEEADKIREILIEMFGSSQVTRSIGDLYLCNDDMKDLIGTALQDAKKV